MTIKTSCFGQYSWNQLAYCLDKIGLLSIWPNAAAAAMQWNPIHGRYCQNTGLRQKFSPIVTISVVSFSCYVP